MTELDKYVVTMCRSIYEDVVLEAVEAEHPRDAVIQVFDKYQVAYQAFLNLDLEPFVQKVTETTGYQVKYIACLL